jgi:hypothetical protein
MSEYFANCMCTDLMAVHKADILVGIAMQKAHSFILPTRSKKRREAHLQSSLMCDISEGYFF